MINLTAQIVGDQESRREGVSVLTNAQIAESRILRLRTNSKDLFVFNGRIVQDDFFDENLLDMNQSGKMEKAPNNFLEVRTLGQSTTGDFTFFDIIDFNPVAFINDNGNVMYPSILSNAGLSDPIFSDGAVGVFEHRREQAGVVYVPSYAKRGAKAFISNHSTDTDFRSYEIDQKRKIVTNNENLKVSMFIEAEYDSLVPDSQAFFDMPEMPSTPFLDGSDMDDWKSKINDEITSFVDDLTHQTTPREFISSAAGWTFINNVNGTDSIAYSDRM